MKSGDILFLIINLVFVSLYIYKVWREIQTKNKIVEELLSNEINYNELTEIYKDVLKANILKQAEKKGIQFNHSYFHNSSMLNLSNALESIINGLKNKQVSTNIKKQYNLDLDKDNLKLTNIIIKANAEKKKNSA